MSTAGNAVTGGVAEKRFDDAACCAAALAASVAERLEAALRARGRAVMAVSGGSSPKPVFQALSAYDLPWSAVTVTQVDERWLDPAHADSNARLIRENLLVGRAAAARFAPLKNAAETPEQGQLECERMLRSLQVPFDVVVLGMGEDGHTASLFPGATELATALDTSRPALCWPMHPPHAPHPRMTLTLRGLLSSRVLLLQLSGASKLAVLRRAQEDGPVMDLPIRAVLQQRQVPLEIWYSL